MGAAAVLREDEPAAEAPQQREEVRDAPEELVLAVPRRSLGEQLEKRGRFFRDFSRFFSGFRFSKSTKKMNRLFGFSFFPTRARAWVKSRMFYT